MNVKCEYTQQDVKKLMWLSVCSRSMWNCWLWKLRMNNGGDDTLLQMSPNQNSLSRSDMDSKVPFWTVYGSMGMSEVLKKKEKEAKKCRKLVPFIAEPTRLSESKSSTFQTPSSQAKQRSCSRRCLPLKPQVIPKAEEEAKVAKHPKFQELPSLSVLSYVITRTPAITLFKHWIPVLCRILCTLRWVLLLLLLLLLCFLQSLNLHSPYLTPRALCFSKEGYPRRGTKL